ncbi:MAG: flagellar FliJ family protein [Bdellovibrionia bacterium]
MKKFNFRFQTVLQVRKIREREFLRQLSRTQRAHQEELNKKSQLVLQLEKAFGRRENLGSVNEDIVSFYLEDNFVLGTKQRILQSEKAILRASKAVERALQTYLLAKRQSKIIETLLEKAQKEYRQAFRKNEEKEMDEMLVMRTRLTKEGFEIDSNE